MVAEPSTEALLLMLHGSGAAGVAVPAPYTCVRNVSRTYMTYFYVYIYTYILHAILHFYRKLLRFRFVPLCSRGYT